MEIGMQNMWAIKIPKINIVKMKQIIDMKFYIKWKHWAYNVIEDEMVKNIINQWS